MNNKSELIEAFEIMPIHQDLHEYWKQTEETEPIKKALRFIFLSNFSFLGTGNSLNFCIEKPKQIVKNNIDWINTNQSFVDFVQDIVAYILTFISLIAVLYIIYAWFSILVSWWNDEVQKKQKKTIFSIIIWIILIWLSYTIVNFIVDLAQQGWTN